MYWSSYAYIGVIFTLGVMCGVAIVYLLHIEKEDREYAKKEYFRKMRENQKLKDLQEAEAMRQLYQVRQWSKEMDQPEKKKSKLEIKKIVADDDGNFLGACGKVV